MITLLTTSTNELGVIFCKIDLESYDKNESHIDGTFSALKTKVFTFFFGEKLLLKSFLHPDTFRDKSSQVLTLFHFVMCICQETEIRYSYSKVMVVKQWNLTAFHFLCVLIIHSSESLSLPVQLEIGRIQKIKLAKNCPILGIILHFREVAWLSHC